MLTGLVANALAWDHAVTEPLAALQERVRFAARVDRRGEALVDYQTVDLGTLDASRDGRLDDTRQDRRSDGASGEDTHLRYRHYRADSPHTVALTLGWRGPHLYRRHGASAREPARPLFIGRKCCLPAGGS